jgi:hypothetical protein
MTRHKRISIYVIAVFGFVYVMANAGSLPSTVALVTRAAAVLVAIGLFVATPRPDRPDPPGVGFTPAYWLIVIGEVTVGVAGLFVINTVIDVHDASIAWISLVVGIHFLGFYAIWSLPIMIWIGAAITLCGAAGLVAAGIDLSAPLIALTAGVLPGAVLLAAGWWSALHRAAGDGTMGRG